jgi:hypothetical protein
MSSMRKASVLAGLHPYRKKIRHKLFLRDYNPRMVFSRWFLALPQNFEDSLIISDESVFDLNGFSNGKNEVEWFPYGTGGNPLFSKEVSIQPGRLMVWAGIIGIDKKNCKLCFQSRQVYVNIFF